MGLSAESHRTAANCLSAILPPVLLSVRSLQAALPSLSRNTWAMLEMVVVVVVITKPTKHLHIRNIVNSTRIARTSHYLRIIPTSFAAELGRTALKTPNDGGDKLTSEACPCFFAVQSSATTTRVFFPSR